MSLRRRFCRPNRGAGHPFRARYGTGGLRSLLLIVAFALSVAGTGGAQAAPVIVVYGDSLSAGYGLGRGQDYVSQMQRALDRRGVAARMVNRSRSGRTSAGGRRALGSIPSNADAVIVQLGGNDGLRGVPAARLRSNLDGILTRLRRRGLDLMLIGIGTPERRGASYDRAFRTAYGALARKHGAILVPNFLDGVYGNPSLVLRDRIHPNARGVARMVSRTLPQVVRLARRAR